MAVVSASSPAARTTHPDRSAAFASARSRFTPWILIPVSRWAATALGAIDVGGAVEFDALEAE